MVQLFRDSLSCEKCYRRTPVAWGFACFIVVVSATTCCGADTEWTGWRGLAKQGEAGIRKTVGEWSPRKNVRWSTAIPGKGHSSPVASRSRIFVTSSIPALSRFGAGGGWLLMASLLLIASITLVVEFARHTTRSIACCLMVGLLMHVMIAAQLFDDKSNQVSHHLSYFDSVLSVGLLIFLLSWVTPIGSKLRFVWVASAIVLPVGTLFDSNVLFDSESVSDRLITTLLVLTLIAGMVVIRSSALLMGRTAPLNRVSGSRPALEMLMMAITLLVGTAGCLMMPSLMIWKGLRYGDYQLFPPHVEGYHLFRHWSANSVISQDVMRMLPVYLAVLCGSVLVIQRQEVRLTRIGRLGLLVLFGVGVFTFYVVRSPAKQALFDRAVICVDQNDGRILWMNQELQGPGEVIHQSNSLATPTPLVYRNRVFAYFGSAGMICVDLEGNTIWTNKELPFRSIYGPSASPIPHGEAVLLSSLMPEDPYITALHYQTGKPIWTRKLDRRLGSNGTYSTPVIAKIGNVFSLLIWRFNGEGGARLIGFAPETGIRQFAFVIPEARFLGAAVPSIIVAADVIYLPNKCAVVALTKTGQNQVPFKLLWQTRMGTNGPNCSSSVLSGGLLFSVSETGVASCLNCETGRIEWKKRLPRDKGASERHFASPIAIGDSVLFFSTSGLTTVVSRASKYKVLAKNHLNSRVYASPAVAGDDLLIRSVTHLWCIGARVWKN